LSAPAGCPSGYTAADWRSLVAHRNQAAGEEPSGWVAALEHLGLGRSPSGCAVCRRDALAADPTLVFHRLVAEPLAAPSTAIDPEVAAVQQAVAALRTASRFGGGTGIGVDSSGHLMDRGRRSGWARGAVRWSAAAGLAAVALTAGSAGPGRLATAAALSVAPPAAALDPAVDRAFRPALQPVLAAVPAAMRIAPQQMPMVEDLNHPDARVYQIDGGNLWVVMIVDEKLDV
jgi:hypothetical protein